jgi:fused signal recognition particle receptor
MFDFLKKKISDFTNKVKERVSKTEKQETAEEKAVEQEIEQAKPQHKQEQKPEQKKEKPEEKKEETEIKEKTIQEKEQKPEKQEKKSREEKEEEKVFAEIQKEIEKEEKEKKQIFEEEITEDKEVFLGKEESKEQKEVEEKKEESAGKTREKETANEKEAQPQKKEKKQEPEKAENENAEKKQEKKEDDERQLKAKVSIGEKLKGFVTGEIRIGKKELNEFLEELELALLESDVDQEAAQKIVEKLKDELSEKSVPRGKDVSEFLKEEIRKSLESVMHTEEIDFLTRVSEKKPFVIMFLGPNGAGKTTSLAKLTSLLQKNGKSCVWAAADTFRAASIEQLEVHAKALGVKVVKHSYGADPAAVAFDAIAAAKAKGHDVVLIDSAGRQETNRNLMEELKKIVRVAKPDLKIYIGEAFTGQALLHQAKEFNETLGIDAFILTKIDADAKGGTAISLLYSLKKPILFVGIGQGYEDLQKFEPKFITERVVA